MCGAREHFGGARELAGYWKRIFRYEIKKYLGGGTYGEVLQAVDHKFDSLVAIKMLNNYTSM